MGMYSSFYYEEIKVLDWIGLKRFIKEYCDYYKKKDDYDRWVEIIKEMIKKDKEFTFGSWDDIKLISYWYDYELIFLQGVAPFIEGEVIWDFETQDECGAVKFKDGKCIITTGVMNYHRWKPMDNIDMDKIPSKLKTQLVLDKLNETPK